MLLDVKRFPPPLEAQFRASRMAGLAMINASTYWLVAVLLMSFVWWDWFVDPVNWKRACVIRSIGAVVVLATGVVQRVSGRIDWAPVIARVRYAASVFSVAGALAVLEQGYVVGLAGLVTVLLSGPHIALDRRDVLALNAVPLVLIGVIMLNAGLDRFAIINSTIFIALAVAASLLLARVLEASNRRAFALEQELMRDARTDALTGLLNRRALEEAAALELKRSGRDAAPLSVILCDIDHFKQINDRYGHDAGDRVLRTIADCLRKVLRDTDALGRWGGEEFLAILPNTSEHEASALAERLRAAVEVAAMPIAEDARLTISLGVAPLVDNDGWIQIVKAADDAMYRAKAAGRNRVIIAHEGHTAT